MTEAVNPIVGAFEFFTVFFSVLPLPIRALIGFVVGLVVLIGFVRLIVEL